MGWRRRSRGPPGNSAAAARTSRRASRGRTHADTRATSQSAWKRHYNLLRKKEYPKGTRYGLSKLLKGVSKKETRDTQRRSNSLNLPNIALLSPAWDRFESAAGGTRAPRAPMKKSLLNVCEREREKSHQNRLVRAAVPPFERRARERERECAFFFSLRKTKNNNERDTRSQNTKKKRRIVSFLRKSIFFKARARAKRAAGNVSKSACETCKVSRTKKKHESAGSRQLRARRARAPRARARLARARRRRRRRRERYPLIDFFSLSLFQAFCAFCPRSLS